MAIYLPHHNERAYSMGREALPDHQKLDTLSPLRTRATPAQRHMWREVSAEFGMTETAFARTSLLILLNSISKYEPQILARAVKRANQALIEQGYPPVTVEEILKGEGLPERGLLTFTSEDEAIYEEERRKTPVQKLIGLINVVLGR
ncbi:MULTISPECIES: hypothetical protein [unclassified Aeromonas]|uniref:hypothetical protein n=1 Tax=unclassified Aeromonas TaxID=257493 RepID=UPI00209AAE92|nr:MULTISPECIES: hypothetical protein [unclassified Aeromonas]